jgi:hypothetical protein
VDSGDTDVASLTTLDPFPDDLANSTDVDRAYPDAEDVDPFIRHTASTRPRARSDKTDRRHRQEEDAEARVDGHQNTPTALDPGRPAKATIEELAAQVAAKCRPGHRPVTPETIGDLRKQGLILRR